MTPAVVRTRQARVVYDHIWSTIAAENPTAADRLLRRFDATLELLCDAPNLGMRRPELGANIRSRRVGRYLLFYRPTDEGIVLLRVLHGARDLKREFRSGP